MYSTTRLLLCSFALTAAPLTAQTTTPGVKPLPGTGCAFDDPWPILVTGSASVGNLIKLDPSMPVFTEAVIVGAQRRDLPLQGLVGCACTLVPDLTWVEFGFNVQMEIAVPNHPSLIGVEVWAQPYYFTGPISEFACASGTPGGTFAFGDAVEITVQP